MKKTLEELLIPIKYFDEQVLRQYTKLAKKAESRGISKYKLATYFNYAGAVLSAKSYIMWFLKTEQVAIPFWTFNNIVYGPFFGKELEWTEKLEMMSGVKNYSFETLKSLNKAFRLPILLIGTFLFGDSLKDIYFFFKDGSVPLYDTISYLSITGNVMLFASALYIRDSDPKLLQKEPLWKKAYNWCKEKEGSLVPQPLPRPVPVRVYQTLEDHL